MPAAASRPVCVRAGAAPGVPEPVVLCVRLWWRAGAGGGWWLPPACSPRGMSKMEPAAALLALAVGVARRGRCLLDAPASTVEASFDWS